MDYLQLLLALARTAAHPKTILLSGMASHVALGYRKAELAVNDLRFGQCQRSIVRLLHHQMCVTDYMASMCCNQRRMALAVLLTRTASLANMVELGLLIRVHPRDSRALHFS